MNAESQGKYKVGGAATIDSEDARLLNDLGSIRIPQGGVLNRTNFWQALRIIFLPWTK